MEKRKTGAKINGQVADDSRELQNYKIQETARDVQR